MDNQDFSRQQMEKTKVVGFICGAWDLLHAGHVLSLRDAKNMCDRLIVGLHINPKTERPTKNRPVQSVYERYIQLVGCRYVDQIIPYSTENDLLNILKTNKIDVRFLGADYFNIDTNTITGYGLNQIIYLPREHNFSSTELRLRILKEETEY